MSEPTLPNAIHKNADSVLVRSRFTQAMPGDPVQGIGMRQVSEALYSEVSPTPVSAPKTLLYSRSLARSLGFDEAFCRSQEFAELMSGNRLFAGTAPFATRYGGHQFGNWAGQLGDGRAINLGELADATGQLLNLQLKGAGPTPYSRGADGRAVLRSSVREFLCSEAMYHLGVPTTRALSLVLTGDSIVRDMFYDGNPQKEAGAIVCRVAPSFTRFGHFQLCAYRGEKDLLRRLIEHTIASDFPALQRSAHNAQLSTPALYLLWFKEVCRLTADMVVHWMRVGFVHGVMNTDNMSILGLTIDYGPYGWLEDYDPNWTPNTTDAQRRRYRFGQQGALAQWNLYQLANALLTVIDDVAALQEILTEYEQYYDYEWQQMMAGKLGLQELAGDEGAALLADLDSLLQVHETDMTLFYRRLCDFRPGQQLSAVVSDAFYELVPVSAATRAQFDAWGQRLGVLLVAEGWQPEARRAHMQSVNPCYVLRNYLAQEAIDLADTGDYSLLHELHEALRTPYTEQARFAKFAKKRPEWARTRAGCSMLSCSS